MARILFSLLFIFFAGFAKAQNFNGQWKGSFIDKSVSAFSWGGDRCDYVVDIEVKGQDVTGYTYTYFTDGGKKFYTICTMTGKADKKAKTIVFTEISRTKTNVPDNITNSFQIHKLKWRTDGTDEILEGTWDPAPGQDRSTGYGSTILKKRQLTEISDLAKKVNAKKDPNSVPPTSTVVNTKPAVKKPATVITNPRTQPIVQAPVKKTAPPVVKTTVNPPHISAAKPPVAKVTKPAVDPSVKTLPAVQNPSVTVKADTVLKTQPLAKNIPQEDRILPPGFERRNNALLQTVTVEHSTVKIDLYDNGEIDGDSISIFYNGKVLLSHKRLSEKPISLEVPVNVDEVNELVMYADNLGSIPPNTALMIVMDGNKRYEVRMTSDLKKSGTIRFVHKSATALLNP